MKLKELSVTNYSLFSDARFSLTTESDRPIVLFSGNNGAGKTSLLEAFCLVLHGRRSFVDGITDPEYRKIIASRFYDNRFDKDCSIKLVFVYQDGGRLKDAEVTRSWSARGSRFEEILNMSVDGIALTPSDAEELITSIIPPEVLRYFFFDGETIKDLAEWGHDEDFKLFSALDHLLGLTIVDQLERDLDKVTVADADGTDLAKFQESVASIAKLEMDLIEATEKVRSDRAGLKTAVRIFDETRQHFMAVGGLAAEQREQKVREREAVRIQIDGLAEELRRESAGYMPLLAMQKIRPKFLEQLEVSTRLEEAEAISRVLNDSATKLAKSLKGLGFKTSDVGSIISTMTEVLLPKPMALSSPPLPVSLREAAWMSSVIGSEAPRLANRLRSIMSSYHEFSAEYQQLDAKIGAAPTKDPKVETLFAELDHAQRSKITLEQAFNSSCKHKESVEATLTKQRHELKRLRNEQFKRKRLLHRERLLNGLRSALPDYASKLRASRELQFSDILTEALNRLWHKKGRLSRSEINFAERSIKLYSGNVEIIRSKLSAAEKQLFATAFIYAVARLSNRDLPFIIDTPVGRLDREHRKNLVNEFLPRASHQIILFSTDTEIVGTILKNLRPLISQEYDLANYNGGVTEPVQLEVAL